MFIGIGLPIPDLSNLPGVSRPGASTGPSVDQIANQYSFKFDRAAGTYMPTGINIAADSNFSVSFWVKGETSAGFTNNFPFAIGALGTSNNATAGRVWGSKFMLQWYDNNNANFGNRIIDVDIHDGNWHHFVFTRDNASGQYFAYADGINKQWIGTFGIAGTEAPSLTLNPSGDLYFGTASANTSFAWDGWLDEFALFDRVLTEEEIKVIYDASTSDMTADLSTLSTGAPTAWYRMGD
tara:strand:- start:4179 stop:4892 length:714 start_codon:yes stop_codon:yes gene_type:complete